MDRKADEEAEKERERILSAYSERDRELIENVLQNHPLLTIQEAIEHLEAFGGL
jgi:hypothetical protein